MRDRDRRRGGQPSGCLRISIVATSSLLNQRASSSSVRSTMMFVAQRLGVAADHQRHRERPGLRAEIVDPAADDAGFLQRLAPHRVLDRSRPARRSRRGTTTWSATKRAGAAEQAALAVDRQHDHDRIGAREMLGLAVRAVALPAAFDHVASARRNSRRSGDARASAAPPWPRRAAADGRASTRPCTAIERRSVTSRSSRAFSASAAAGAMPMPKRPAPSMRPRKTVSVAGAERRASASVNSGSLSGAPFFEHDQFAADDVGAGARSRGQRVERRAVGAPLGGALDAAVGVAEARFRAEIGARRTSRGKLARRAGERNARRLPAAARRVTRWPSSPPQRRRSRRRVPPAS